MAKAARKVKATPEKPVEEGKLLRIDLGCGKNKREGFIGVDSIAFEGVDIVGDLTKKWPWDDSSVDEVHCSHFLEHLEAPQRVHFANELWRVLKPGAKATIITPYWASARAYGDMTHKWPPVSEFWFPYLSKEWRKVNAPHNDGYSCDFEYATGYNPHPGVATRSPEAMSWMLTFYKEAAQDMMATLTAKK